ncbi:MAG: serine/threonine protein kinase, partial [Gemmatimonadetes bacterium]|nr:serine/threonine protein kinase [Gemmatimonadota bacterium]
VPGDTAQDVMRARLVGRPRAMSTFRSGVPQGIEAVVAKALTRDPAGRYPTMETFADALAPFGAADAPSIGPRH